MAAAEHVEVVLAKALKVCMTPFDVVLSDVQKLKVNHHRRDAQNKPVWRELTCVTHT